MERYFRFYQLFLGRRRVIQRTTIYKPRVNADKNGERKAHPLDRLRKKQQQDVKTGSVRDLGYNKLKIRPELKPNYSNKDELKVESSSPEKPKETSKLSGVQKPKFNQGGATKTRKIWKKYKEDEDLDDVEVNTEKPYFNQTVTAPFKGKQFETQSNIDGYSQSDIWERESHGYLENSKKLLERFKKRDEGSIGNQFSLIHSLTNRYSFK